MNQEASFYRIDYFGFEQSEEKAIYLEDIAATRPMNDLSYFYPGFF
jgi:hypothetical protein